MKTKQKSTIKLSKKCRKKLASLGDKGDTYEDIIWKLIKKGAKRKCKKIITA